MVRKNKLLKLCSIVMLIFCTVVLFTGCRGLRGLLGIPLPCEYDLAWVCDSPYIYIGTQNNHPYDAYIGIDGEIKHTDVGWENDGTKIYLYETGTKHFDKDLVWAAECEIVREKLYITVVTDNYFNCEGETFVLEQRACEPEEEKEE